MYISEISGHHSATLAVEKAIRLLEPDTEILNINAFCYTNPISERIVNKLYLGLIKKLPQIWDYLYDNPKVKRIIDLLKNIVHYHNSPKLNKLFNQFNPQVIAVSQAFPCGMVADFKKLYHINIPLVAILTDYIPHSYWIYDAVNYYIAPCEDVKERLIQKQVEEKRIKTYGIPASPEFNKPIDKKTIIKKLNLKDGVPIILIMGGGQGLGPIKTVVGSLDSLECDLQEIIVTGTNRRLYHSLHRELDRLSKKVILLDFVDNIFELMSVANLIITKPGGVTTAEALTKNLPMLIIKPIPGQEESNTDYLINKGVALKVGTTEEISVVIRELLQNPNKLSSMSDCAARASKPRASQDIARLLLDLCNHADI